MVCCKKIPFLLNSSSFCLIQRKFERRWWTFHFLFKICFIFFLSLYRYVLFFSTILFPYSLILYFSFLGGLHSLCYVGREKQSENLHSLIHSRYWFTRLFFIISQKHILLHFLKFFPFHLHFWMLFFREFLLFFCVYFFSVIFQASQLKPRSVITRNTLKWTWNWKLFFIPRYWVIQSLKSHTNTL